VRLKGLRLTHGFYLQVWGGHTGRALIAPPFTPQQKPNPIMRNIVFVTPKASLIRVKIIQNDDDVMMMKIVVQHRDEQRT